MHVRLCYNFNQRSTCTVIIYITKIFMQIMNAFACIFFKMYMMQFYISFAG